MSAAQLEPPGTTIQDYDHRTSLHYILHGIAKSTFLARRLCGSAAILRLHLRPYAASIRSVTRASKSRFNARSTTHGQYAISKIILVCAGSWRDRLLCGGCELGRARVAIPQRGRAADVVCLLMAC
jgi:hypothetical protein